MPIHGDLGSKKGSKKDPNLAKSGHIPKHPFWAPFWTLLGPVLSARTVGKCSFWGVKKMTFFGPFLALKQVFSAQERFLAKK